MYPEPVSRKFTHPVNMHTPGYQYLREFRHPCVKIGTPSDIRYTRGGQEKTTAADTAPSESDPHGESSRSRRGENCYQLQLIIIDRLFL